MDIYKNNEDLLFGGDIVRAKGKKQQGLLSWFGCPQVEIHLERTTRKLRQEYTRGALNWSFCVTSHLDRLKPILGATSRTRLHLFPWHHFFVHVHCKAGTWRPAQRGYLDLFFFFCSRLERLINEGDRGTSCQDGGSPLSSSSSPSSFRMEGGRSAFLTRFGEATVYYSFSFYLESEGPLQNFYRPFVHG